MFCYQCEQTAKGEGCSKVGVCGKTAEASDIQDLLEHALRGLALVAVKARDKGIVDRDTDAFVAYSLFSNLTNVNFDHEDLLGLTRRAVELREALKEKAGVSVDHPSATFVPAGGRVHSVKSALDLLESLVNNSSTNESSLAGLMPLFHWCRLVETHNGDLLDFLNKHLREEAGT